MANYLPRHSRLLVPDNYTPTRHEDQIIRSSAIGDGCILYPYKGAKNPRLSWSMGNESHAEFICESFSFLGATLKKVESKGFGDVTFRVTTKVNPLLGRYHNELYINGVKTITSEYLSKLSDEGWAWWLMDDGHTDHKSQVMFLHTEGSPLDEVERIRLSLSNFIGLSVSIHSYIGGAKKRKMHCIRLNKKATYELTKKIAPYFCSGMEYKIISSCR